MARELKLSRDSWWVKNDDEWQELNLEDAYTDGFVEDVNSCSHRRPFSDYSNELYLYYFVKNKELENTVGEVSNLSCSWRARLTDKSLLYSFRKNYGVKVNSFSVVVFYLQAVAAFSVSLLLSFFVAALLPFIFLRKSRGRHLFSRSSFKDKKKVFFIRSKSGYSRVRSFIAECPSCMVLADNFSELKVPGESIYSVLWSSSFLGLYMKTLQYTTRDLWLLFKDARALLGNWMALSVFWAYWKRIPQKALYEACFEEILRLVPKDSVLFSGEKEDRFAMLQTRCCAWSGINLTCLPHGLEYGFRFPGGLCGSTFYCFSEKARELLESIYSSKKFLYSDSVLNKMLGINENCRKEVSDRVCFFTEPRDQNINFEIIDQLIDAGVKLSIKLHPLENQKIYQDRYPGVDIISDLEDGLSSSFCLSRKSTVLIEASQRGKQAIAVLVNRKDRFYVEHLFPSLSSEEIVKVYDFKGLVQALVINNDG